jgi:hypothetical protein
LGTILLDAPAVVREIRRRSLQLIQVPVAISHYRIEVDT